MPIATWKKPIRKGYMENDSHHVTFWKGQNYGVNEKVSGCQGLKRREGRTGGAQGVFRAVRLLCVTLPWWTHVLTHLSKTIDHNTKNEP